MGAAYLNGRSVGGKSADATSYTSEDRDKIVSTARARLALKGYTLHIIDRGVDKAAGYMVSRWDRSVVLDWSGVERFMQQVGA